jgi:hypothetical protein
MTKEILRIKFVTSMHIPVTMNDILKKKLASYSAATASLLVANHFSTQAQIIYTDIPDTTGLQVYSGDFILSIYDLDLNNDGIVDFELYGKLLFSNSSGALNSSVMICEPSDNAFVSPYNYPTKLDCGESINAQANFATFCRELDYIYCLGSTAETESGNYWNDNTPHCLGLRFSLGGDTLYGWVRLKVENYGQFEIYDYAYNSIPNEGIAACEGSSFPLPASIVSGEQSSIRAFVSADNLTAVVSNNLWPTTLRVINIMGEAIVSKEIINEKNEINLSTFPVGIYLVTIGDGKSAWSRKIVLSR